MENKDNSNEYVMTHKAKFNLICASKCKKYALESAKRFRPSNHFSRVSQEFLIDCENALRMHIDSKIKSHPSIGKTLMK